MILWMENIFYNLLVFLFVFVLVSWLFTGGKLSCFTWQCFVFLNKIRPFWGCCLTESFWVVWKQNCICWLNVSSVLTAPQKFSVPLLHNQFLSTFLKLMHVFSLLNLCKCIMLQAYKTYKNINQIKTNRHEVWYDKVLSLYQVLDKNIHFLFS